MAGVPSPSPPSERCSKRQRITDDENHLSVEHRHENEEHTRLIQANQSSRRVLCLPETAPRGSGIGHVSLTTAQSAIHWSQLVALHDLVSTVIPQGVRWGTGSSSEDPRRRMYAFLPGQRQRLLAQGIRMQTEGSQDEHEHEFTMSSQASMDLFLRNKEEIENEDATEKKDGEDFKAISQPHILTQSMHKALQHVTDIICALVPNPYKRFVTLDELVAVQPNHHNGAKFLPAHLDFARSDGFGVVIATLCIRRTNNSKLILIDDGDTDDDQPMSWSLELHDKDCYWLSGDARNKCVHGILSEDNPYRETLNLRYGLHSVEFANEEIERHWQEN